MHDLARVVDAIPISKDDDAANVIYIQMHRNNVRMLDSLTKCLDTMFMCIIQTSCVTHPGTVSPSPTLSGMATYPIKAVPSYGSV